MLLALCVALALPAHAGQTLDRVRRTGVLNNVLLDSYAPFSFLNERNELDGFDVEVARAVAERIGAKLRLLTPGWEAIVAGNWRGRWDVCICSLSPTQERARVLNFVARYYSSPAVLVVNRDEKHIQSVSDLSGRRVGVIGGSSYEAYLHKALVIPGSREPIEFPFHDVIVIPGDEAINFRNLALGPGVRLDAIIADLATSRGYLRSSQQFRIVGGPLYAEPNVIATDKGDPEFDALIARAVGDLRSDGTLARISRKWFDQDITDGGP